MSLKLLFRKLISPLNQQKSKLTFVVLFSILVVFFTFGLAKPVSAAYCAPHLIPLGSALPGEGTIGNDPGTPPYPPCPTNTICNTNTGICVPTANASASDVRRINNGIARKLGSDCGLLPDDTSWPACGFGRGLSIALNLSVNYFFMIPLFILGILAMIIKLLLVATLKLVTSGVSYTELNPNLSPAVANGWPIVRNFANIILVLGLIIISLATILRVKAYEAKQLLGKLIIVAFLVNFSLVICGLIIDISNILLVYLLTGGVPNSTGAINFMPQEMVNFWEIIKSGDSINVFIAKMIGNILFNLAYITTIPLYICLFLFRVIALWILVILSPLAFVCSVFPKTQHIYEEWKNNFIQWCFVGVFGALFLFLGNKINTAMTASTSNIVATLVNAAQNSGGPGVMQSIFQSLTGVFSFIVPALFLVIGFIFSLKFSAMGSDIALKAGKAVSDKVKGYAMDKSGINKMVQKTQNYATQKLENAGLLRAGYTKAKIQRQLQPDREYEDAANAQSAKGRQASVEAGPKAGLEGQKEWMANFEAMVKNGEQKNLTDVELKKSMANYAGMTGETSIYSKAGGADYVENDRDAINELKRTGKASTDDEAIKILRKKNYKTASTDWMKDKTDDQLATISKENSQEGTQALERLIKEGKQHLIFGGNTNAIRARITDSQKYGIGTSLYSQLSPEDAVYDEDRVNAILIRQGHNPSTIPLTDPIRTKAKNIATQEAFKTYKVDTSGSDDAEVIAKAKEPTAEGAKFWQEAIKRGILGQITSASERDAGIANATQFGIRPEEAAKSDYRYYGYIQEVFDRVADANPKINRTSTVGANQIRRLASLERLDEVMPKMDNEGILNVDLGHITYQRMKNLEPRQIRVFQKHPDTTLRTIINGFGVQADADIAIEAVKLGATPPPDAPEKKRIGEKIIKLRNLKAAFESVV